MRPNDRWGQCHGTLEVGASGGRKISMSNIIKPDELTMTVSSTPWRSEKEGSSLVTSPSMSQAVD
ncbi:hypothetical protein PAXINDRAFT_21970 [Paxillus involutus ATCC 200175]|uniref:Uncharacterized protein n=1 Tax=Paxillus involutus ATCC 200175 TaxID=664439 RepID=A0A0C9T923_PAXIN|nr:hypothetical protein PAXINDRAFT_21970 [Paxillus involutus ATCC 200175]